MSATPKAVAMTKTTLPICRMAFIQSSSAAAGGSQVPVRPMRELQHDDRLGAAVDIIFRDELLRQFGVLHRVGHMALHLGIVGASQRDAARQGPELA